LCKSAPFAEDGGPLREHSRTAQNWRLGCRRISFSTAFHFFRSSRAR
jgi:hypothetical protein